MLAEVTHIVQPENSIVLLLAALLGGSAITGAVSWWKLTKQGKVEKEEIITRAAEQAVGAMKGSLTRLEVELEHAKEERDKIEVALQEAVKDRIRLEERVKLLNEKIIALEKEIAQYKDMLNHTIITTKEITVEKDAKDNQKG